MSLPAQCRLSVLTEERMLWASFVKNGDPRGLRDISVSQGLLAYVWRSEFNAHQSWGRLGTSFQSYHPNAEKRETGRSLWLTSQPSLAGKLLVPERDAVSYSKAESNWGKLPGVDMQPSFRDAGVHVDKQTLKKINKLLKRWKHSLLPVFFQWPGFGSIGGDQHFLHEISLTNRQRSHHTSLVSVLPEGLMLTVQILSFSVSKHQLSCCWRTCCVVIGQPRLWATELNYDVRV